MVGSERVGFNPVRPDYVSGGGGQWRGRDGGVDIPCKRSSRP